MFYVFLFLALSFYASYSATRKADPAKARTLLNVGLVFALVFGMVSGGYAIGRDLARADSARAAQR